jgi:hypothetical protein
VRRLPAILLVLLTLALAGLAIFLSRCGGDRGSAATGTSVVRLPSLALAEGWVNGTMTDDSLRGRPVALVVWSDTDPRGLRLLREAEAWQRAYARYGARVIGIHSPDFSFAARPAIAAAVARRMRLSFPIAFDPAYSLRKALGVDESPAILIASPGGGVVLQAGAGGAARADRVLRELVRKSRPDVAFPEDGGAAGTPDPPAPEMRFVYLGTARAERGPLAGAEPGRAHTFTTQFRYQEEGEALVPYPVGRWTPGAEGLTAARGGAANFIALRTVGGRVAAVLAPAPDGASRVWVLDGDDWLAAGSRGEDVREDATGATYVDLDGPRLYAIARGAAGTLKLSPGQPGIVVHGFAVEKE